MCGLQWGFVVWILVLSVSLYHQSDASEYHQPESSESSDLSVSQIQATGKVLFRALRNSECNIDCSNKKRRLVCGSDGVTYHSRCHLKKVKRCEGRRVKVRRKGKCSGSTDCLTERENAQAIARKPTIGVFIPECKKDGSFAEVQCHAATGYCWCASKDGKPVVGTSQRGSRPVCKGKHRRRKIKNKKIKNRRKRKRICRTSDRIEFNKHLVNVFKEEYNRMVASSDSSSLNSATEPGDDHMLSSLEKKVVLWKFSELDRNKDNKLRRREVRNLKRVVKKLIKPRACAKNFVRYCDLDQNKRIEPREWTLCLDEQSTSTPEKTKFREDKSILLDIGPRPPTLPTRQWPSSRLDLQSSESRPPVNDGNEDRMKSCTEERNAALRQQQDDPNGKTFIPRCTADGKWVKEQCHEPSQYCWCVVPETGSPVSGTATEKVKPNCAEREMKGCPFPKKRRFLSDLINMLNEQMNSYILNGSDPSKIPNSPNLSIQEKSIRWKFNVLDISRNSMLERKELKNFRKNLPSRKDTRKCRRNFVRYCDENVDRKVTLDEWTDCMGINSNNTLPKRRGRNPFEKILNPS